MLLLWRAVQGLLESSFSFPNVAIFRAVLPRGGGFGSCEACRSVIVRDGGARCAPAQPAQLIVQKPHGLQNRWSLSWQYSWSSLFLSKQHHLDNFWTCPEMSDGKEVEVSPRTPADCWRLLCYPIPLEVLPPRIHLLQVLMSSSQEENFMRIYALFGVWDSPSITRLLPMAHSPVS